MGIDSIVESCISMGNQGGSGIFADDGSVVSRCASISNSGRGIICGTTTLVINCTARLNSQAGVEVDTGSSVVGCACRLNQQGIVAFSSTVSDCVVEANTFQGISAGSESSVRNCLARVKGTDGISVQARCHIVGNTCNSNGVSVAGAGIRGGQAGNRIDGNSVFQNVDGIVAVAGNLVIRNMATANTGLNYNMPLTSGPIIPAGAIVSEHPWANIEF